MSAILLSRGMQSWSSNLTGTPTYLPGRRPSLPDASHKGHLPYAGLRFTTPAKLRPFCLGAARDGVKGEWRRLHNEKLHDLYSPNVIWVRKLRKMRWAGHVARMGAYSGSLKAKHGVGHPGVNGKIILK